MPFETDQVSICDSCMDFCYSEESAPIKNCSGYRPELPHIAQPVKESLCKSCIASCRGRERDVYTLDCTSYLPETKPSFNPYAAVDGFLKEYEHAKGEHDWSTYDLLKAARKVLTESCELLHAVEHWDEGRDTIEHIIEELNHVGGTGIRMRLMVEEMGGKP